MISDLTREFKAERSQRPSRFWNNQSNTDQCAEVHRHCVSVEETRDDPAKDVESVLRKVVAAQLAGADGVQKVSVLYGQY